jgi:hypothetical protein
VSKAELEGAMRRLFERRTIIVKKDGPASRQREVIDLA